LKKFNRLLKNKIIVWIVNNRKQSFSFLFLLFDFAPVVFKVSELNTLKTNYQVFREEDFKAEAGKEGSGTE